MLKFTRPFIPSFGLGQLSSFSGTGNDPFYTLNVTPGNPMASYDYATVVPVNNASGYVATTEKVTNFLKLGFSTNVSSLINTYADATLVSDPTDGTFDSYYVEAPFGKAISFIVVVTCPVDFFFSYSYDISGALITSPDFPNLRIMGSLIAGSVLGVLNKRDYKVWKFDLTAKQAAQLGAAPNYCNLDFTNGMGNYTSYTGVSIINAGLDINGDANIVLREPIAKGSFSSAEVAHIDIVGTAGTYFMAWRKLLPDTTTLTITTGVSPATSSSLALGAVTVNSTVTSNVDFFNCTVDGYIITGLTATLLTPNLASLSAINKGLLASDFRIYFVNSDGSLLSVPAFPATAVTNMAMSLALPNIALDSLDSVKVNVVYAPKLKVLATQIVPYVATTDPALSNQINVGRKIKVQIMGVLASSPAGTAPTAIGDPFFVSGTV